MQQTSQILLPQVQSAIADGVLTVNPYLILLFYLTQLFLRELVKSYRLIQVVPMHMYGYYVLSKLLAFVFFKQKIELDHRIWGMWNVISQILLCKHITPDFNQEELCSITKDTQKFAVLLGEMQDYMPRDSTFLERSVALYDTRTPWLTKRRRNSFTRTWVSSAAYRVQVTFKI